MCEQLLFQMKNNPLTEDEIITLGEAVFYEIMVIEGDKGNFSIPEFTIALARTIEQAHGIGDRQ